MNLPILFIKTATGAIQQWLVKAKETTTGNNEPGSWGIVETTYGQVDGKLQTTIDIIKTGKNLGKANETTAVEQAALKAKQLWDKKVKEGYVQDLNLAAAGETNLPGIEPMLAFEYSKKEKHVTFPAWSQPKLDGFRCIAVLENGVAKLYSRTRKLINTLPHINKSLEENFIGMDIILDGELYVKETNRESPYEVFLTSKGPTYIDKDDLPLIKGHKIYATGNGYAAINGETREETLLVHRIIMGQPQSDVDHINRNKLDNRKSNLRLVDDSHNLANTSSRINSTSGFKGVYWFKRDQKWQAQIQKDGKQLHLGYFENKEDAAKAYDKKAYELFGEYAFLNFPINFNQLASIIKRDEVHEDHKLIQYHIYDVASQNLVNEQNWESRFSIVHRVLEDNHPYLKKVETLEVNSEEEMREKFQQFLLEGYEGLMLRNKSMVYENKRSAGLLKVKTMDDAEFEIVGVQEGTGKLMGKAGALICKTAEGKEFKAKMKGSLESLSEYLVNFDKYKGKQLTVQFQGVSPDGIPRFPVGLRIREDI